MDRSSSYSRKGLYASGSGSRGCWYYLKYFFLFVSLIQFLIILGLVLFMVYGNAHAGTEAHLQVTEKRADNLSGQLLSLTSLNANLSKELNVSTRARESIMQLLVGSRRDLDRINSSYRQCQAEQIQNQNYIKYILAIIRSEALCQETLLKDKQNCTAQTRALEEKAKLAQVQQDALKIACNKEKDTEKADKARIEAENKQCNMDKLSLFGEHQLVSNELQRVRDLCAKVDKEQLSARVEQIWRESLVYRNLDSIPFYYSSEMEKMARHCREVPRIVIEKVDSLARELKSGIDQVARENTELQRQKEAGAKALAACKEEKEKVAKETQERLQKLQEDCVKQGRLAMEEKAALQREKEALIKELEQKKEELILVKGQLDINKATLDTCIKTKAQGMPTIPRPPGPVVNPTRVDLAGLEEFKKRMLELYQKANVPPGNPASG